MSGVSASGFDYQTYVAQYIESRRTALQKPLQDRNARIDRQTTQISNIETRASNLLASIRRFIPSVLNTNNVYNSFRTTSSSEAAVTATVGANASAQTANVEIRNLATSTRAASLTGVGQVATDTTTMSQLGVSDGVFNLFVSGVNYTISVASADSINDVLSRIRSVPSVSNAAIGPDGKFSIEFIGGSNARLGSTGDTSNFLSKAGLYPPIQTTPDVFISSNIVSTINTTATVTDASANLATPVAGGSTFQIGKASFSVDGKSLQQIITEINSSADAGVTATFNSSQNRMELISKTTGQTVIQLNDTSGNFLQSMGLVTGGGNSVASQTLGENAEFVLNGQTLFSTSNTVDSNITGMTGVTLSLKQEQVGVTNKIEITQSTADLKDSLKDFVAKYNDLIATIDQQTGRDGLLNDQSTIRSFRSQLRQRVADSISGTTAEFNSLQTLGVSTGKPTGAAVTGGAPATLQFDEATFDAAYAKDPQAVTNAIQTAMTSLRDYVQNTVTPATTGVSGIFQSARDRLSSVKRSNTESIDRSTRQLDRERDNMLKRFQAMDRMISQFRSQQSQLSAIR